jgi:alpha-N-arabinofuranosidase
VVICARGPNVDQQNSIRDVIAAGITLHIFHQHCDRVEMANIAQVVNVLQSMILTKEKQMILTPTYHVFEMFKVHQDAELLTFTDVQIELRGLEGKGIKIVGTELTSQTLDGHNTFEKPESIKPRVFNSFSLEGEALQARLSLMSITVLTLTS